MKDTSDEHASSAQDTPDVHAPPDDIQLQDALHTGIDQIPMRNISNQGQPGDSQINASANHNLTESALEQDIGSAQ